MNACTRNSRRDRGFTLIELLIVVAIIAILAAIAVPNFLEAQVRSKVSRARTDMRTMATALEAYRVDTNRYPYTVHNFAQDLDGYGNGRVDDMLTLPFSITTPVSYITSLVPDVFRVGRNVAGPNTGTSQGRPYASGHPRDITFMYLNLQQDEQWSLEGEPSFYTYTGANPTGYRQMDVWGLWQMRSVGPTGEYPGNANYPGASYTSVNAIYDATNGTVSLGQVIRTQKSTEGRQN